MKNRANNKIFILLLPVLLIPMATFTWLALSYVHTYRREHFPSCIMLVKEPQYRRATWRIHGKEHAFYDTPEVPGYKICAKSYDNIKIKEELGYGISIIYDVNSFFAKSKLQFMNFTISEINSDNPMKCVELIY